MSTSEVQSTIEQWATPLMQRGVIVRLEIKRWRGNKRISPEELGIDEKDDSWISFKHYMSLGTRKLLTRDVESKLSNIDNKSRKNLKDHSFETVWGRFVPCTMFKDWQENDKKINKEYFEVAEEISSSFDKVKDKVIEDYKGYCYKIWKGGAVHGSGWKTYQEYEDYFISKIENEIISASQFKKSFEYKRFGVDN